MLTRRRFNSLTCAIVLLPAAAMAQSAPPPGGGACYEMLAAEANTLPGRPLLINKCTGQTFVLMRVPPKGKPAGGSAYRWQPIAVGDDSAEAKPKPATAATAGHKCFSLDGRKFCP
jgi:hypothetical protein